METLFLFFSPTGIVFDQQTTFDFRPTGTTESNHDSSIHRMKQESGRKNEVRYPIKKLKELKMPKVEEDKKAQTELP